MSFYKLINPFSILTGKLPSKETLPEEILATGGLTWARG